MGPFSARYAGLLPVPLLRRVLIKKQRSFGWRRHVAAGTKNDSISQRCSATWAGLLGCLVLSAFFGSMLLVALNLCENVSTRCLHATLVHSLGVSDPLSFASELVNIVGSFRSSGESNQRSSTKLRIFVLGPFRRAMNLTLSSESTIQDVLHELRRRRLIPELTRLESAVIFQGKNIKSSSTLHEAGIHELSTLHLRYSVLGGSQRTPEPPIPASSSHSATSFVHRHRFPSDRPDVWLANLETGRFSCKICPGATAIQKHIRTHEGTDKHRRNLARVDKERETGSTSQTPVEPAPPPAEVIRGPLLQMLQQLRMQPNPQESWVDHTTGTVDWNSSELMDVDTQMHESLEARNLALLATRLEEYLNERGDINSDDEDVERSDSESSTSSEDVPLPTSRKSRTVNLDVPTSEWFPWPDRETCVLDVLRHIPRCSFSKKQNAAIHWAMLSLGLKDLPSDRVMDDIDKALQPLCGIQSIRYSGKLGHTYYTNDFAAIIAQEMANPSVRKHLHFLPEDSGNTLSQAWQAARWRHELDPDLATPMIRLRGQDFYVHEPAILHNGNVCMPTRWFERSGKTYAQVWRLQQTADRGWIVDATATSDVLSTDFMLAFPAFIATFRVRNLPDPRNIYGIHSPLTPMAPWTLTDPTCGNRWRKQSHGHRVVAFPVWLYCDDTSGNTSKKWNKHNSFLFTAAGLPRRLVHRESNIHFLSTSNIAPPLEMLDGIVDQLCAAQTHGIWAWDSLLSELVLVIPSVLAMLGDNPMQSEFACHIGFRGKFFCRVCRVKGDPEDEDDGEQEAGSDAGSDSSAGSGRSETGTKTPKKKKKKKNPKKRQTVAEMISRITQFMTLGPSRSREFTCAELKSQFAAATVVGGKTEYKGKKTDSGVKDTYMEAFLEKIFAISTKPGVNKARKQAMINSFRETLPGDLTSPVWRIKNLDPTQDTPVEILHVILLGFVKYFWRDAIARLKPPEKAILSNRLSSFDVSGLGISPLSGRTLVDYSGSLTGRDFRAIAQAAPFVLHGLLSKERIHAWAALAAVVSLVWQPEIQNLDAFTDELEKAIDHLLNCTCILSLNWFNKPKFHVILHLPTHIRRFGPAMLFATEGFESYNAIIRACSVHSNRHAPSRDIAWQMARSNRIRHLLNGGLLRRPSALPTEPQSIDADSPWMKIPPAALKESKWFSAGKGPRALLARDSFGARFFGIKEDDASEPAGTCRKSGPAKPWSLTRAAKLKISVPSPALTSVHTPEIVILPNGDTCKPGEHVVFAQSAQRDKQIGRVVEIVQLVGSRAHLLGKADFIVLSRTIIGEAHALYCVRQLEHLEEFYRVDVEHIICTVNVQHNCADNACKLSRTKQVRQEREIVTEKAMELEHRSRAGQPNWLVNTGQMRDAASLAAFRYQPDPLDRARIVREAAEVELEARQTKAAAAAATIAAPGHPAPSESPAPAHSQPRSDSPPVRAASPLLSVLRMAAHTQAGSSISASHPRPSGLRELLRASSSFGSSSHL